MDWNKCHINKISYACRGWILLFFTLFFFNSCFALNWSFPPIALSETNYDLGCPKVVADSTGRSIAVWGEDNGTLSVVKGAVLNPNQDIWIPTNNLSIETEDSCSPLIGIDQAGNAIAIWTGFDGISSSIRGAILPAGSLNWIPTSQLSDDNAYSDYIQLSVNAQGKAMVVWESSDGSSISIKAAILNPGSYTWIDTNNIPSSSADNFDPQVCLDNNGNAVVVWLEVDGVDLILKGARLTNGSLNWQATSSLSSTGFSVGDPSLGVDASGNAVAIWSKSVGSTDIIEGAKLAAGTLTWISTASLSSFASQDPKVGVSPAGKAVAVWISEDSGLYWIQGAVLEPNSLSWTPTSPLSTLGSIARNCQIAIDAYGNASTVWTFSNDPNTVIQFANLKSGSLIWENKINLSAQEEIVEFPRLAINNNQFVVVIWSNFNHVNLFVETIHTLQASPFYSRVSTNKEFVIANGVSDATITVTVKNSKNQPMVGSLVSLNAKQGSSIISPINNVTNESGQAFFSVKNLISEQVTYVAKDMTNNVEILETVNVTFGTIDPPLPPRYFKGRIVKNKFLNRTEIVHVFTWKASDDPSVVGYRIYQGKKLVGTVSRGSLTFELHNRKRRRQYHYFIVSVNAAGNESSPVEVTLK